MTDPGEKVLGVVSAIIGLAVLAIVISGRANTVNVLGSFFSGLTNLIGVAISPITGQSVSNLDGGGLTGGAWSQGASNYAAGSYGLSGLSGGLGLGFSTPSGFGAGLNLSASGVGNIISGLTGSGGSGFIDSGSFGS